MRIRGVEDENQGEWRLRIRKCGGRESGGMENENQGKWRMTMRKY